MKKLLYTLLLTLSAVTSAYGMESTKTKKKEYTKLFQKGLIYYEEGRSKSAWRIFQTLSNQNIDKSIKAKALIQLGLLSPLKTIKNRLFTREYFELAANATDNLLIKNQAYVHLANNYIELGKDQLAIDLLRKVLKSKSIDKQIREAAYTAMLNQADRYLAIMEKKPREKGSFYSKAEKLINEVLEDARGENYTKIRERAEGLL